MASNTTLFRARVPSQRLKKAGKILEQLGLKPGDAFNMLLAQIELRKGLPFEVSTHAVTLLTAENQATEWKESLGAY